VGVRAQDFSLDRADIDESNCVEMKVQVNENEVLGSVIQLGCSFGDKRFIAETKYTEDPINGEQTLYFDKRNVHYFDSKEQTTLQ
jgi:hypothetical protein